MNYDVLDALRRRLVSAVGAGGDAPQPDPRDEASRRTADAPTSRADLARPDGGRRPEDDESADEDDAHLRDVPDGAGCTEIWEHLSERQAERRGDVNPAGECQADD